MPLWADAVAVFLALTGLGCVLSAVVNATRRPDLYERLAPFSGASVGEQAERWLRSQIEP